MNARNIEKYVKDYLSDEYDFERYMVVFRRNKILEILQKYQPDNILEIGCGMSSIFSYYNNFKKAFIVEPSTTFIHKAKEELQGKNIIFLNDFIENRVEIFENNQIDFIILSSLLHEVKEPKVFLRNILNAVKQDTIIHINVPNSESFHLLWAYESGLIEKIGKLSERAKKLQQHSIFSLRSLEELVLCLDDTLNVQLLEKGSYFVKPFNHFKMSICLQENILNDKLLEGLEKMIKYMPELGAEIFVNIKKC
ncbi:class I SAM-dependent methyltransferase [Campylobacter devanensis]|uniref:class I SAM-dependent methyltransferase n=1 Tax=Campylobacter devanensis TaxID=3161138 RepID=UPI001F4539B3|nr:methyltransferase domain-containing protein [Campylobacter sp. P0106]